MNQACVTIHTVHQNKQEVTAVILTAENSYRKRPSVQSNGMVVGGKSGCDTSQISQGII